MKTARQKSVLYMSQTRSLGKKLPDEEEKLGKRDGSLTLTVGIGEKQENNGESPAGPKQSGIQLLVDTAVAGALVEIGVQVDEDFLPSFKWMRMICLWMRRFLHTVYYYVY